MFDRGSFVVISSIKRATHSILKGFFHFDKGTFRFSFAVVCLWWFKAIGVSSKVVAYSTVICPTYFMSFHLRLLMVDVFLCHLKRELTRLYPARYVHKLYTCLSLLETLSVMLKMRCRWSLLHMNPYHSPMSLSDYVRYNLNSSIELYERKMIFRDPKSYAPTTLL